MNPSTRVSRSGPMKYAERQKILHSLGHTGQQYADNAPATIQKRDQTDQPDRPVLPEKSGIDRYVLPDAG